MQKLTSRTFKAALSDHGKQGVDVSDTIEARFYNARRATLLQRRPSTIIDAAESFHPAVPMQFYGGGETHLIGSYRMDTKLTGATRTVLNVDTDVLLATSAIPTVTVDDFDARLVVALVQGLGGGLSEGDYAAAKAGAERSCSDFE
jgi:hypothetical protein